MKRRWLILVPLAIGAAMAPVLARLAPERFRSEALILVVPQQVPDNYVQPTVSQSVADRLPSITDEILSRSRLQPIIEELNLYPAERANWVMQDVVDKMRKDVTISAVGRQVDSFRVSYVSDNPEKARLVTERLAGSYRDENTKSRANQANSTSDFLDAQLKDAKDRLIAQEKRLEDYRKANTGQLPSQLQGNLQAIQNTNFQLQAINESINRAQERRLLIERQLADARALQVAQPEPVVAATPEAAATISPARRLEIAEANLGLMLQRNTPDHPDVVTLRRVIEDLKVQAQKEAPAAAAAGGTPARALTPAEIAQQQRISTLDAELAQVNLQISTNQSEAARLRQTIADYQAKVDAVPTRESELVELTRDYSTLQAAYGEMLMKRENAAIAARLERQQIGEQFRTVDQASLPQRPDNQRERIAITASGAIAGLVLGVLMVGVLEYRDSSFRRPEEVIGSLQLPVLASIPVMVSERERRRDTRRQRLIDAGGAAIVTAAVVVLVVWRLAAG
jgi:polysaccharide chain length determinant protein (PEP-CTERM system associated)